MGFGIVIIWMRGSVMHFEILVEDQSGKKSLEILVPKIIGNGHTFNVHSYKGIGKIPKNLNNTNEISKRILLNQLPRLLRGYGKTFANYPASYSATVVLVCDLDSKDLNNFLEELQMVLDSCSPQPKTKFCIAIEEGEAWFLGDIPAIKAAFPDAKDSVLSSYINDSICGTWEVLADAVYKGGSTALIERGWQAIGSEKSKWAERISTHMDVMTNGSPSFIFFKQSLLELVG
mgnify:CR=1 FL=1